MSKIDHSLFNANEHALENAYGSCPECEARLQLRRGKSGVFVGCSRYPECHFSKPLHEHESSVVKVMPDSPCPECGHALAIKKGRFGLFIGCSHFPECHHIESNKQQNDTHLTCPQCQQHPLIKRTNRFGKSFYACDGYPKCKYVLNHKPVAQACPECGWSVMVERKMAAGMQLQCPQKNCGAKCPVPE